MNARVLTLACFVLCVFVPVTAQAQGDGVTFEQILNAESEPQNWLTYSGGYDSQRHTVLDQIDAGNVDELELKWVYQAESLEVFQTSPIVVDGIMYLTEAPNTVVALDAKLGRVFWRYEYTPSNLSRPCCGRVNRGLGILGHTLYMATIDARLIAIDARTGRPLWFKEIADADAGYAMTLAPLIIKDKIIIGVAVASTVCGGSSRPTRPTPVRRRGGSTPFPDPGSPVMRPGRVTVTPGCMVARRLADRLV